MMLALLKEYGLRAVDWCWTFGRGVVIAFLFLAFVGLGALIVLCLLFPSEMGSICN